MNINDSELYWLMCAYYYRQYAYYHDLQAHIAGINENPYSRPDIREWTRCTLDDIWEKISEYERQYTNATHNTME